MYVISVKQRIDSNTVSIPDWEYIQYDNLTSYLCFGVSLRLARLYSTVEEAEEDFQSALYEGGLLNTLDDEIYDLSTLGIREVHTIFKTAKMLPLYEEVLSQDLRYDSKLNVIHIAVNNDEEYTYDCPMIDFATYKKHGLVYDHRGKVFHRCEVVKGHKYYSYWKRKNSQLLARHIGAGDPNEYLYITRTYHISEIAYSYSVDILDITIRGTHEVCPNDNITCSGWEFNSNVVEDALTVGVDYFKENLFKELFDYRPLSFRAHKDRVYKEDV